MKAGKIITGFVLAGLLMGGGYNCCKLVQNNALANKVKENIVYAGKNQEEYSIEETLKSEAMAVIKKYYDEAPDFSDLTFSAGHESTKKQTEDIDMAIEHLKSISNKTAEDEKWIKKLQEYKNKIKSGRISISWIRENNNSDLFEVYGVDFNDATKEVLNVTYKEKFDLSKIKPENLITIEESKKVAEDFILKNKLEDMEKAKLTGKTEYETYCTDGYKGVDTVFFMYQDANDASKKVNVEINRITGDITYFSVGECAEIESTKNEV